MNEAINSSIYRQASDCVQSQGLNPSLRLLLMLALPMLLGLASCAEHDNHTSLYSAMTADIGGNIDTQGLIRASVATTGVASPTLQLRRFSIEETHMGEGVWNLGQHRGGTEPQRVPRKRDRMDGGGCHLRCHSR